MSTNKRQLENIIILNSVENILIKEAHIYQMSLNKYKDNVLTLISLLASL